MTNINARLVRAIDGAAPQYKIKGQNKFEAAEGSNGAQHVKMVDSEGQPQSKLPVEVNFPQNQNVTVSNQIEMPTDYPDAAVEARLQNIEQTQSQILAKLNDTIDTRLTGRNIRYLATDASIDTELDAGQSETAMMYSTDGWIAKISNLYLGVEAVGGATQGDHRIVLGVGNTSSANRIYEQYQPYNKAIYITPQLIEEIANRLNAGFYMGFDNTTRLFIYYQNSTDAPQTTKRTYRVLSLEEKIIG